MLEWLDDGVDSQGQTYVEMRRRLVSYFDRRDRNASDELADETLNRIGKTLERDTTIAVRPPARYCYVVARFVFLEDVRRERVYRNNYSSRTDVDGWADPVASDNEDASTREQRLPHRDQARAREWVDRALQKSPMDAEARVLRARLSAEDGQHHSASEDLLRAVSGPMRMLDEAVEVAKTLEADEAVRVLRKIRQQNPNLVEAQVGLADALQRGGHDRQAEAEYRELAPGLVKDARVPFGLGRALLDLSDYSAALDALDAAAALGEGSGELHARRGETLIRLQRYPEAVAAYRQALRTNVENVTWRLNLGIALAASGPDRWMEAEQRFREVLAMDSGNTRAWEELHKLGARF